MKDIILEIISDKVRSFNFKYALIDEIERINDATIDIGIDKGSSYMVISLIRINDTVDFYVKIFLDKKLVITSPVVDFSTSLQFIYDSLPRADES